MGTGDAPRGVCCVLQPSASWTGRLSDPQPLRSDRAGVLLAASLPVSLLCVPLPIRSAPWLRGWESCIHSFAPSLSAVSGLTSAPPAVRKSGHKEGSLPRFLPLPVNPAERTLVSLTLKSICSLCLRSGQGRRAVALPATRPSPAQLSQHSLSQPSLSQPSLSQPSPPQTQVQPSPLVVASVEM